jgi:RNA polymerase sigma factor (sigma-70 family)
MIGRFADLGSPEAFEWYLRRTVVNLANSHFRHAKVEKANLDRQGRNFRPPADPDVDAREDTWRKLLRLPERQRAALVLRFYEDLTEVQIAEVLGCPFGTVKSLVSRGLARLRGELATER